jgi:hypothetical protein
MININYHMGKLKSFKSFSEEKIKRVVIAVDTFDFPSLVYEKMMLKVEDLSTANNYAIYVKDSLGPIILEKKVRYLRKIFPKHGRNIIESMGDISDMLIKADQHGYNHITIVTVNSDQYKQCLKESLSHTFKNGISVLFMPIDTSELIESVKLNSLDDFSKSLPKTFGEIYEFFNEIRSGLGLKPSFNFRKHTQLKAVSETREAYIQGQLFSINDRVNIIGSDLSGIVSKCGPNYIIVEASDGKSYRKWLNAVEKI